MLFPFPFRAFPLDRISLIFETRPIIIKRINNALNQKIELLHKYLTIFKLILFNIYFRLEKQVLAVPLTWSTKNLKSYYCTPLLKKTENLIGLSFNLPHKS